MRLPITVVLVTAAAISASAQRASTPRTPWGDPDLLRNILSAARAEERQRAR